MSYLPTFALIGGLYLVVAASPGPNFFIISQLSLEGHPRRARQVAAGVALGSTLWAGSAMAGLAALLSQASSLATVVRWMGAIYLVWYGLKLIGEAARSGSRPQTAMPAIPSGHNAFRTGLLTSLTNPKSAAFWTSVFASTLPADAPTSVCVGICTMIAILSAAWHLGIALVFSSASMQSAYSRIRRPINAVCGALLVSLGLRQGITQ